MLGNKVTVIVPTYKRPGLMKKVLNNLKEQTYKNLEIIVINDNGLENDLDRRETYKELKQFIERKEIIYIELENNIGGAAARNLGINNATGDYISFYDDDDEYAANKIELQVNFFRKNRERKLAFVKCEMQYILNGKKLDSTSTEKYFKDKNLLKQHILNLHGIVGTTSFLFDSRILKKEQGFDNVKIRQEYMLILKLLKKGYKGLHMQDVLVTLDGSNTESITRTKNEEKVKSMEYVLKKRLEHKDILAKEEIKKIYLEHYLDLAEWYSNYKNMKSFKFLFKSISLDNLKKYKKLFVKLILLNLIGNKYYLIREKLRGY